MATKGKEEIDKLSTELVELAEITSDCERCYENVLASLKKGEILPLVAHPLLKQHLEIVNNMSVIKMVETRLKQIKKREIAVLVTGEFNAGKSTFVNILMGGQYLPMDRGKVTHVVCEIRYNTLRLAVLQFEDKKDDEIVFLKEESTDAVWEELRVCIRTKEYNSKETGNCRVVKRIIIYWPLKILEGILNDSRTVQLSGASTTGHGQDRVPSWNLPPEFLSRLQRPHARSFRDDEYEPTRDPDQTNRKEVVPSTSQTRDENTFPVPEDGNGLLPPKSKPIEIKHKAPQNTTTPIRASVELASDASPASHTHKSQCVDILHREKDTSVGQLNDDDQCETEKGDTHQTNVKTPYEQEAQGSQTRQEETRNSISKEQNTNQGIPFQFVFLDCPGIDLQDDEKDSPEYSGMVGEVERCQAFIFILDTTKDTGVKKRGIKALMEDIDINFRSRGIAMNPDQSLFIANKADEVLDDTVKSEKLRQEVAEKLAETWPLTRNEHIFLFQANKELKDCLHRNERLRLVQRFLLDAMRLTLEEDCIWLLRMLEIAHAMAKLGQQSSPVVHKLANVLEKMKQETLALQEEVKGKSDTDIRRKAWNALRELILRHETDFRNIQWDRNEIRKRIPNEDLDWQEISHCIHTLIGEKIEEKIQSSASRLREDYAKRSEEIFKSVDDRVESIKASIFGLEGIKEAVGGLKSGIFMLFAPAAISVSARAAPVLYPFVFLAAPILPVGLFGQVVIEDIRESRKESKRREFKTDAVQFIQKETDRVLDIAKLSLKENGDIPDSPLHTFFFGESRKKTLHYETEKVLHVIDISKEMTYQKSESSQKCCKKYIIQMLKFYVDKVMKHRFTEKDDIIWIRNAEGIRRTIEHGSNACTYEANVSERFGFKKLVAVKEFRCKLEPSDMSSSLPADVDAYRECFYLRQLSRKHHEKLVNFLGTGTSITDGYLNLRIVMERYIGNLKKHVIASPRSLSNKTHRKEFLHYAKECTEGLKFLHDNNVIHRDVKPSNYLIKEACQSGDTVFYSVVISDVGCAKAEETICTLGHEKGTRVYWAPEISLANTFHSKSSDVFSLGLVLWEVWVRKPCYDENGRKHVIRVAEAESIPVVKKCLRTDPRKRITASYLLTELLTVDN